MTLDADEARVFQARPLEVVRLGFAFWQELMVQRLMRVLENALPGGNALVFLSKHCRIGGSGMAQSCRVVSVEGFAPCSVGGWCFG